MSDWSLYGLQSSSISYPVNTHLSVTSHSTNANQKGNWTEIIASLPYDAVLTLRVTVCSNNNYDYLIDVGVGAAGSEIVAVENLIFCNPVTVTNGMGYSVYIPLIFPSGTRISLRTQSTTANKACYFAMTAVFAGGFGQYQLCKVSTTYGANTADSGGTQIDPGGSAGTDGNWSQLTAATTRLTRAFFLMFGNILNAARTDYLWSVEIGIGAAGSEQIIVDSFKLYASAYNDIILPQVSPVFPINIPAGTRLAARASCSGADATDRLFDVILYAFS